MNQRFTRATALAATLLLSLALGACSLFGHSQAEAGGGGASGKDSTECPVAERMQAAPDSEYGQHLMARFSKLVAYPAEAADSGQAGQLSLCARLTRDGKVRDARIAAGSGYPVLDGAALLALGQLTMAPAADPMPKDFAKGEDAVWFTIPVNFQPPAGARGQRAPEDRPCKETGSKQGDIESGQVSLKEWGDFPGIFSDAVKQELVYPGAAVESKQAGYTLLCVSLDRDSHLLGASISRSSGYPLLDAASLMALGMVQIRAHMPPLPDRVRQAHDRATFTQEIDWKPDAPAPKEKN